MSSYSAPATVSANAPIPKSLAAQGVTVAPGKSHAKGVSFNHPDYGKSLKKWRRCRLAIAGQCEVKEAATELLPKPEGFTDEEYAGYLERALYYNMARRTKVGLVGAATMKDPEVKTEEQYADYADELIDLPLMDEQLETGRAVLLVNQDADSTEPSTTLWLAESIVNWRWKAIDGKNELQLLVLEECDYVQGDDEFTLKEQKVRHVYKMVEGKCKYEKHTLGDTGQWTKEEKELATAGGRPLDHVPACVVGSTRINDQNIDDPVLIDLVDVNISWYQNSADLEHGRHWTALPTAYAIGFPTHDKNGAPITLAIGGKNVWLADMGSTAQCGYLEFSGSGLGHIETGMEKKQGMAAVLGARLLENQQASVESAETKKVRLTGERCVLSFIAQACSRAKTWALREMIAWGNVSYQSTPEKDYIAYDTDFLDNGLAPGELTELMGALQAELISYDTFYDRLKKAEVVPHDRTAEEERKLIAKGLPGKQNEDPVAGDDKGGLEDDEEEKDDEETPPEPPKKDEEEPKEAA